MTLRFSVITCTWNSARYLDECIESVRSQDYKNYEHVFVDGGSTDGTLEKIKALDGDVKWVTGVRGGISNAMNEGVRLATGDVVSHLHSDDFYASPRTLSIVAAAFDRQPQAQWLYGRCVSVVDGERKLNEFESKPCTPRTLIRRNLVPHPATFVRREAFLRAGLFDTSLKYAMDYDLWLRLVAIGPPIQLEDYLSAFRFHEGSASTRNAWRARIEDMKVRLRHVKGGPAERLEHFARFAIRLVK